MTRIGLVDPGARNMKVDTVRTLSTLAIGDPPSTRLSRENALDHSDSCAISPSGTHPPHWRVAGAVQPIVSEAMRPSWPGADTWSIASARERSKWFAKDNRWQLIRAPAHRAYRTTRVQSGAGKPEAISLKAV